MIRKLVSVCMAMLLGSLLLPLPSVGAVSSMTYDVPSTSTTPTTNNPEYTAPIKAMPFSESDLQSMASGQVQEFFGLNGSFVAIKNTKLYRSVNEAELKQIQQTGKFEAGPNSLGGKFFAESADDAKKWGDALGNSRLVETQLPRNVADGLKRWERLDGIGPARYGELNQLRDAIIREVK